MADAAGGQHNSTHSGNFNLLLILQIKASSLTVPWVTWNNNNSFPLQVMNVQHFELFKSIIIFSAWSDASYPSKTHPHILSFPGRLLIRQAGPSTGNLGQGDTHWGNQNCKKEIEGKSLTQKAHYKTVVRQKPPFCTSQWCKCSVAHREELLSWAAQLYLCPKRFQTNPPLVKVGSTFTDLNNSYTSIWKEQNLAPWKARNNPFMDLIVRY